MPHYDYKCERCGTARTLILRLSELDGPVYCPNCRATPPELMTRQPTAAALQFKGAGWTPRYY